MPACLPYIPLQPVSLAIVSQVVDRKAWRKAGLPPVRQFIKKVKADPKGVRFSPEQG